MDMLLEDKEKLFEYNFGELNNRGLEAYYS